MKTAIIFGITGQDGSYLAELLLDKGYKVVGVTRRVSVDTLSRINHIASRLTIIEGDITDSFSVNNIINQNHPHEIYNLAAQSHVGTSFNQPSLTWDVTAGGCFNILEAIRYSERCTDIKFYQASSSEMFGKEYTAVGDVKFQDEATKFMPNSPYAAAKLAAHNLVRIYRKAYGIHASAGILFNHESERRGEQFVTRKITKWASKFHYWRKQSTKWRDSNMSGFSFDENNIIYKYNGTHRTYPKLRLGNLNAQRDWGHAEDYVKAMWLMVQNNTPDDYIIATGETHSIKDLLAEAFKYIKIDDFTPYVMIDPQFYRPVEVDYLLGSTRKALKKLGWKPEISFAKLVHRMMEYDIKEDRLQQRHSV